MENQEQEREKCGLYIDFLLDWTKRINLVSGSVVKEDLDLLIKESLLLGSHLSTRVVVDAGSGNGILGVPLALRYPEKSFFFVETRRKKIVFLQSLVQQMNMANVQVSGVSIQEFYQKSHAKESSLIARGFPNNAFLSNLTQKKGLRELLIISSAAKIRNLPPPLESYREKQYNIPWRSHLLIYRMEKVSRET